MAAVKTKAAVKASPSPAATLDDGPATAYAAAASGMTTTGPDVDVIGVRATPVEDVVPGPADDSTEVESNDDESDDGADDERTEDGGDASEADEESEDDEADDEDPDEADDVAEAHDDGAGPSVELEPVAFDIEMDEPEPWPAFTDDDIEPVDTGAYDEPVVFDGLA